MSYVRSKYIFPILIIFYICVNGSPIHPPWLFDPVTIHAIHLYIHLDPPRFSDGRQH